MNEEELPEQARRGESAGRTGSGVAGHPGHHPRVGAFTPGSPSGATVW